MNERKMQTDMRTEKKSEFMFIITKSTMSSIP